jgi:hypothetical protein
MYDSFVFWHVQGRFMATFGELFKNEDLAGKIGGALVSVLKQVRCWFLFCVCE